MSIDFHRDMDRYLASKRRKKLFSGIKSKVMNKKAVVSYKAGNKFGELKGKVVSKVDGIKKRKKESERGISQEDINKLVDKKGIKREQREDKDMGYLLGEGWKEVKLEKQEERKEGLTDLEEKKRKLQESLAKIEEKESAEKERLTKLIKENEGKEESDKDKVKRLELEEEIKVLKEKERIEEDRLAELKKARRIEQMESLRGRVKDILFKKKPKIKRDMLEQVRDEVRRDARMGVAERQRISAEKPKEEVIKAVEEPSKEKTKGTIHNVSSAMEMMFGEHQHHEEKPEEKEESKQEEKPIEEKKQIEKKPKKSFFSNFIEIKTAEEIAKEEREKLRIEEERALKDQSKVNELFGAEDEIKTNVPEEEQSANLSTLFPGEEVTPEPKKVSGDTIELDQGYKIKVIKNQ